ncbi:hypothetical protein FEE95_12965 [Maribacter algarum]|uniref:Uncharacterized protein n=1 Tax=Maribacter algarum (ex Zhang et al. 2020) TaxID=2578118 RepID=A0A5S3PRM8_9FLAO|nr:hypothetical protein [Maribacter algarum]TMM57390.1 hypothetical protein FEE95_12965 [Maribacter algarum]
MENHFQLSDLEFEKLFERCELDPSLFSHEAHLRLAWIHISTYGIDVAVSNIQSQIKAFVKQVGAEDKYNATLTVAAIRAVYHFMLKSESTNFKDFIKEFPRLKNNFKELIDTHYGFDIFNSKQAKTAFLEPDLLPFD